MEAARMKPVVWAKLTPEEEEEERAIQAELDRKMRGL